MSQSGARLAEVTAGGIRWRLWPEYRDRLVGPDGLRLDEWVRAGQARVVKDGPHRTVYHVALPGLDFYLKHYRLHGLRAWLRQALRPAKARREFDRATGVASYRIPTITPLGFGIRYAGLLPADSYLLTRGLPGVTPLSRFLGAARAEVTAAFPGAARQELGRELGVLIARMHRAGILHQDLHAANLLVRLEGSRPPGLFVIDLHAVHLGRPLAWPVRRANLVMLNRSFILHANRADRLRFWLAYCEEWQRGRAAGTAADRSELTLSSPPARLPSHRPTLAPRHAETARDLERRTWISNLRFWKSRDRRCLQTNRRYEAVRAPGVGGHVVRDLDAGTVAALLADPDEPFRRPGIRLLKDSRSTTVAELELRRDGVLRPVIYKRFRVTSRSDPWAALVRTPPALRSWIHGHGLRERGLPTARPLAVLHRRRRGLVSEGYLLTEKIAGAQDLRAALKSLDCLAAAERRAGLWRRIEQVAGLVRELHRRQLSHRDLKAANVLADKEQVWLIDLVGVRRHRRLRRGRRVQNLARLHASFHDDPALTRTDKVRFLRVYLQWGLFGRGGWKTWWKAVERATRAKVARNRRRGRPLA